MIVLWLLLSACQPSDTASGRAKAEPVATRQDPAGRDGAPALIQPIDCRIGVDCEIQNYVDRDPGPGAVDYQCGARTYDDHSGIDFRLPDMDALRAGVAVLAAADGVVARVRDGVADISVNDPDAASVEGSECGNGVVVEHAAGWSTQYCHLRQGSVAVAPGQTVRAGQPIAQVGLSGNTEYAHLHLTVRHDGNVIDPFAPDGAQAAGCGSGPSLWADGVAETLVYRAGVVLNAGFSSGPVDMADVEAGGGDPASITGTALVAYVRAIGLKVGDVQSLRLAGPGGLIVADTRADPLPRDQAQRLLFAGKRRPAQGWAPGEYVAVYSVTRDRQVVLEKRFSVVL